MKVKKIKLLKLKTLPDAIYPQEKKYKSGTIVSEGYMDGFSYPEVGRPFWVLHKNGLGIFHTSNVNTIITGDGSEILLTTLNSKYKIIVEKEEE